MTDGDNVGLLGITASRPKDQKKVQSV